MVRPDPRIHDDLPGLKVGLMFCDFKDLYNSGLHGSMEKGIFGREEDGGAFSIVLNGGYEDDDDKGDLILYTGEGKGKAEPGQESTPGKKQLGDQDMNSPGNAALKYQAEQAHKYPVRVIRGPNGTSSYHPEQGYRYDGLYDVVRAYLEKGKSGFKMCKFELRRCTVPEQPLLPSHIKGDNLQDMYWSPDGPKTLAEITATKKLSDGSSASRTGPVQRTVAERNQTITGHSRLPKNVSFKRTAPSQMATEA